MSHMHRCPALHSSLDQSNMSQEKKITSFTGSVRTAYLNIHTIWSERQSWRLGCILYFSHQLSFFPVWLHSRYKLLKQCLQHQDVVSVSIWRYLHVVHVPAELLWELSVVLIINIMYPKTESSHLRDSYLQTWMSLTLSHVLHFTWQHQTNLQLQRSTRVFLNVL